MRRTVLILAFGLSLPFAAQAQQAATLPADQNLDTAARFRNITPTGTTKPPGGAGAASEDRPSEPTRKQQAIDRKVDTGICIGCN